jgi:hypothetical protein
MHNTHVKPQDPKPLANIFNSLGIHIIRSSHTRTTSSSTTSVGRALGLRSRRASNIAGHGRSTSRGRRSSGSIGIVTVLLTVIGRCKSGIGIVDLLLSLSDRKHLCGIGVHGVDTKIGKVHAQTGQGGIITQSQSELIQNRASRVCSIIAEMRRSTSSVRSGIGVFTLSRYVSRSRRGLTGRSSILAGIFKRNLARGQLQISHVERRGQVGLRSDMRVVESRCQGGIDHTGPARVVEQGRNGSIETESDTALTGRSGISRSGAIVFRLGSKISTWGSTSRRDIVGRVSTFKDLVQLLTVPSVDGRLQSTRSRDPVLSSPDLGGIIQEARAG